MLRANNKLTIYMRSNPLTFIRVFNLLFLLFFLVCFAALLQSYAFKGVDIFLIFGEPITMVGNVLLLPANIDILNPTGIACDMIYIGGESIKAELQRVDAGSIVYGSVVATTAGFLQYTNIFHLIIADYQDRKQRDNYTFALQQLVDANETAFKMAEEFSFKTVVSPVIGLGKFLKVLLISFGHLAGAQPMRLS